jgi:hypothetical protein
MCVNVHPTAAEGSAGLVHFSDLGNKISALLFKKRAVIIKESIFAFKNIIYLQGKRLVYLEVSW